MDIDGWLKQATRCLARDSAARVRSEIQEHYESAREAALAGGASRDEADRLALSSLGDARTANRQYRRVLLTRDEAKLMREADWSVLAICSRPWVKRLMAAAPIVVVAAAAAFGLSFWRLEAVRDVLIVAVGLSPLLMAPLLPIYTPSRGRVFRYVKWAAMIAMFALVFGPETLKWSWLLISCMGPMAWNEWLRNSIRRKLPVSAWPKHLYL